MNFCSNCGEKVGADFKFCVNCGKNLNSDLGENENSNINFDKEKIKRLSYRLKSQFKENKKFRLGIFSISVLIILFIFMGNFFSDERKAIRAAEASIKEEYMRYPEVEKVKIKDTSAELKKREDQELGEEGSYKVHGYYRIHDRNQKRVYEFLMDVDFFDGEFIPEHSPQVQEIYEGDRGYF